ncbi:hypothetical protein CRENPOLYSF2_2260001 [Crenothrix polyspora]|uniref:Uncharacterized protein n=1 Tax=Crenothrix polyspora TaxID=360316 RepID=A0A1R4H5N9_9GAMM|nr:hypothetical protein CRENPOLYSF2_2260001 [Crenothrix polyspora]
MLSVLFTKNSKNYLSTSLSKTSICKIQIYQGNNTHILCELFHRHQSRITLG